MDAVCASLHSLHCHKKGWVALSIATLVLCSVAPIASSTRPKISGCEANTAGCGDGTSLLQLERRRVQPDFAFESTTITSSGIIAVALLITLVTSFCCCGLFSLPQQPSLPNEKTPLYQAQGTTPTHGTPGDNGRPWLVLACFSFHGFCNQFMYMNFTSATQVAEKTFHADDGAIHWLYSASLLGAVPSFLCVMAFSTNYRWVTTLTGIAATVVAAWLRYLSMLQKSLPLAIMSSVALGPGTGLIFVGFAELPVLLFPQGWNQQICAGIAVQISFFGWAMGGLVSSLLAASFSAVESFFLVQALCVSIALPMFLCWGHQLPPDRQEAPHDETVDSCGDGTAEATGASNSEQVSRQTSTASLDIKESAMAMVVNWRFQMQALGMALLQAVGYTVPAVQLEVFTSKGYDRAELAMSGFLFIMAGVALGMLLAGPLAPAPGKESVRVVQRLILTLFWTAALAVFMLQLCVAQFSAYLAGVSHQFEHFVYFFLMFMSGACCLGFLNITLPVVCAAAHPVPETYSGGTIELSSFALGALLTQLSTGFQFKVCTLASLGAAILMTAGIFSERAPASSPLEEEPADCTPGSAG